MTEREFAQLISRIMEDHEQLTEVVPQTERVSSQSYNQFFGNVQVDLDLMFAETDLVERALSSYERLYDGIIADLSNEIKALQERINNLRLVAEGEKGLVVKSFDFTSSAEMETDRTQYAHLFRDRDGSQISDVEVQKNSEASYLSLKMVSGKDRIRDESGKIIADLQIIDHRGIPVTQNNYPIANAIDDSRDSYWGEVVLTDEPIESAMDGFPAGGAMVKFTVTFTRPEIVSEITLSPFTTYPLEIVSIKYEEDIESYHQPKELVAQKTESTQTMTVQFPSIVARRFTFILRQKNNVRNRYLVLQEDISKADLWNKLSKRETEITLTTPNNPDATLSQQELDVYSGWDIYQSQLQRYESQFTTWTEEIKKYREWLAQADTYKKAYEAYRNSIATTNRQYGTNYVAEKNALE